MKDKQIEERIFRTRFGKIQTGKNAEMEDVLKYFQERDAVLKDHKRYKDPFKEYIIDIKDAEEYFTAKLLKEVREYTKQQRISEAKYKIEKLQEELKYYERQTI